IGSSVEPGLPNIVVIPWARKRSNVASRTVGIDLPPIPSSPAPGRTDPCRERARQEFGSRSRWGAVDKTGVRNRSLKLPLGVERVGIAVALACAALLCLAASASAGPTATRLVYAPGKIVP